MTELRLLIGGQAVSRLGSSFTAFALPLLVFLTTRSALDLGIALAAAVVPYLIFGLVIGAWVDRSNRKRLMIAADLGRALLVATLPLAAGLGVLSPLWIYAVQFGVATLTIIFEAGQFAIMPRLAVGTELTALNGRIQATYAAASVIGPVIAGMLVVVVSVPALFVIDAVSFAVSAASIALIRTRVASPAERRVARRPLLDDVRVGLRYVFGHPVLRNIAIMMALVNLVGVSAHAQLVLFARTELRASDAEISWLYAAESLGTIALSLLVAPLRRRLSFVAVALGALTANGALVAAMAVTTSYPIALLLRALCGGTAIMFNVAASSLRQQIVPDDMLGRVMTVAGVLAWSMVPLGALAGGALIDHTGDVARAYLVVGALTCAIPIGFAFSRAWNRPAARTHTGGAP